VVPSMTACASERAISWLLVCLKDQHYTEEKDAQSHKIEKMVLHPATLSDGGKSVTARGAVFSPEC
jgi:hypothetical protein